MVAVASLSYGVTDRVPTLIETAEMACRIQQSDYIFPSAVNEHLSVQG